MQTRWLGLMIMLVACVEGPETEQFEQSIGEGCPPWACANSDEVLHYGMHDANLLGVPNAQNITLGTNSSGRAQIYSASGVPYNLHIQQNRFVGLSPFWLPPLQGNALVGATLRVLQGGVLIYTIRIDKVRTMMHPFHPYEPVEVYRLMWFPPGGGIVKNVCNTSQFKPTREDLFGMAPDETLIFAGDRIDGQLKTASAYPDFTWFNFGCAAHTLAKMHLTRNTITTEHAPDWKGRQATLKMFVGDYCGTGRPFTVSGTPIRWKGGVLDEYWPTPGDLEARWTEQGARCLATPRLVANPSPDFPGDVMSMIFHQCPTLAVCANLDISAFDGTLRVTANPL